MPTTDELIRRLATEATPLPRNSSLHRLAVGVAVGITASSVVILAWLGSPLQAVQSTGGAAFAMKLLFAVALTAISFWLLLMAGRPGRDLTRRWLWLLVPPALIAVSTAMELALTPPDDREQLWLGSTWRTCLVAITLLSIPVFAGVVWAFRHMAPTHLRAAGLLAGLTAGSAAATLYALYCPETTAVFLLSWYSLGILAAGAIGALLGPRLLRW